MLGNRRDSLLPGHVTSLCKKKDLTNRSGNIPLKLLGTTETASCLATLPVPDLTNRSGNIPLKNCGDHRDRPLLGHVTSLRNIERDLTNKSENTPQKNKGTLKAASCLVKFKAAEVWTQFGIPLNFYHFKW